MSDIINGIDYLAGAGRLGSAPNYVDFSHNGDIKFVGDAGLIFAGISGKNQDSTITISGTGVDNKVQVIAPFTTNGESNGSITPSETDGHIQILVGGRYIVVLTMTIESGVGAGFLMGADIWKNNGQTQYTNLHAHEILAGGGGDTTHISITGGAEFAANDTVEVWIYNEDNTVDIIVDDINLFVHQVGGNT